MYSSKSIYLCKNDNGSFGIALGSAVIDSQPFYKTNFYTLREFFLKFQGTEYTEGKIYQKEDASDRKSEYLICHIEL